MCAQSLQSAASDFVTPWTVVHHAPLSMGFSRQECWRGLPCPPPGDLPDAGIKPMSPAPPALQEDSLLLSHWGGPYRRDAGSYSCVFLLLICLLLQEGSQPPNLEA